MNIMPFRIACGLLYALCQFALADDRLRPNSIEQLGPTKEDAAVVVEGAEILYINRAALARDYPEIARLIKSGQIGSWENWTLQNYAIVSRQQTKETRFNTNIPVKPGTEVTLYRGPEDGRSGTVEVKAEGATIGLMGLKGVGLAGYRDPSVGLGGLLEASTGVAELGRQQYIQRAADIENAKGGSDFQTGEIYFLIKQPFKTKEGANVTVMGRQPQTRSLDEISRLPESMGLTPNRSYQASVSGAITDFGNTQISGTHSFIFRFPDGKTDQDRPGQNDRPYQSALDATRKWEARDAGAIEEHLRAVLAPLDADWAQARDKNEQVQKAISAYGRVHPGRLPLDVLLQVFLHTEDKVVAKQLGFALALHFQRNPIDLENKFSELRREMSTISSEGPRTVTRGCELLARTFFDSSLFGHTAKYLRDGHDIPKFSPKFIEEVGHFLAADLRAGPYFIEALNPYLEKAQLEPGRERESTSDHLELFTRLNALMMKLRSPANNLRRTFGFPGILKKMETLFDEYRRGKGGASQSLAVIRALAIELVRSGSTHEAALAEVGVALREGTSETIFSALTAIKDSGLPHENLQEAIRQSSAENRRDGELATALKSTLKTLEKRCIHLFRRLPPQSKPSHN